MADCYAREPAQKCVSAPYRRTHVTVALLACTLAFVAPMLRGQRAEPPKATDALPQPGFAGYDVVSIKANVSGSGSMRISSRETTLQATNTSLVMMLEEAYGTRAVSILGLPKWTENARWDINAKVVDPSPEDTKSKLSNGQGNELYRSKVRSILTDRFHLKAHKETRVQPIYELVVLPGPQRFKKSEPGEEEHAGTNVHNRNLIGTAISFRDFAAFLSDQVGRTVLDKTGLEGTYDFALKWSADDLAEAAKDTGASDRPPEIYTALQEQLGLKLVSGKGPAEVLIVDSVEQPVVD